MSNKKEVKSLDLLKWDPINGFKNVYSTCLLIFSVVIVMGLIGTEQTNLSSKTSPAVAYCNAMVIVHDQMTAQDVVQR